MHRLMVLGLLLGGVMHPLHTTHTELEELGPGQVGITIRAFTDDLHRAVARHGGGVSDSALAAYVRRSLELRPPVGAAAALHWQGVRTDGEATLLRFRAAIPGGLRGTWLRQAMHAELFSDQVNVVQARYGHRRVSLLFTPGDPARRLP